LTSVSGWLPSISRLRRYASTAWSSERDIVQRLEKLAAHPDPDVSALALASLHYAAGRQNDVRRVLAAALRQSQPADQLLRSRWVVILGYLADKARGEGSADVAISTYHKALEVEPENARVNQNLGLAFSMTRSLDQAVEAYRRSLEIDGSQPLTLVNLGIAYDEQGQAPLAVSAYERALALNEHEPLAWFNLGNVYLKSGDLAKAKANYERALASDPSIAPAHFYLARIALQQRDFPAALAAVESGLEFDPKNAEGLQMRDQLQKAGVQPRRASPGGER
jgi:tetratricopeptide (TPR) repeat protein